MTTVLIIFTIALVSSLLLTPLVKIFGIKSGALDKPDGRKVHTQPIPRVGGLAMQLFVRDSKKKLWYLAPFKRP